MRRLLLSASAFALVLGFIGSPSASAQQSFNLYIGGFTPRTLDARGTDDVLFQDGKFLSTLNRFENRGNPKEKSSGIDISEFNNVTVGGEWLVGLGRNLSAGLGLGLYQRTVPTVYTDFVKPDGTEIFQDLKLRIVPFTATVRFLPLGNDEPFQPYLGAGVSAYSWRYSETGQFIDAQGNIFTDNFVGSGGAVGPVVLGGARVSTRSIGIGAEIRWQGGSAALPPDEDFAGSRIDLGGFNYLLTVNIPF